MAETVATLPPHARKRFEVLEAKKKRKSKYSENANFMGLAIETRLQIYGYLLAPTPLAHVPRPKKYAYMSTDRVEASHCCIKTYLSQYMTVPFPAPVPRQLTCYCDGGNREPAILATCKQIFEEAMPVLYESMELRIPILSEDPVLSAPEPLELILDMLPKYAPQHITRVAVIGSLDACRKACTLDIYHFNRRTIAEQLSAKLPKLRELRLQMWMTSKDVFRDVFRDPVYTFYRRTNNVVMFGCLVQVPGVRKVMVGVCDESVCYRHKGQHTLTLGGRPGEKCAAVVSAIKAQAEATGKRLEVVEEADDHKGFP